MPRTCLACTSPNRAMIDAALASGDSFRNISKRVSISPAGLLRHKAHVRQVIIKAAERREECLGDNLLEEMRRVQQKAWDLLGKAEAAGDTRGAIVACREVRECLGSLGDMLAQAGQTLTPNVDMLLRVQKESEEVVREIMAFQRESDGGLADVCDAAILEEAKRRGLPRP